MTPSPLIHKLPWIVLAGGLVSLTQLDWYFEGVGCHPTFASITVISAAFAAPIVAFETLRRRLTGRWVFGVLAVAVVIEIVLWTPLPFAVTRSACP